MVGAIIEIGVIVFGGMIETIWDSVLMYEPFI